MTKRLHDKRCLIVGGTSGIGLTAARRFVEEGARLIVAGLDEGDARGLCPFRVCDATNEAAIDALFAEVVAHLGGLDVLYHVAGGSGRRHGDGPLHDCTSAGWQ